MGEPSRHGRFGKSGSRWIRLSRKLGIAWRPFTIRQGRHADAQQARRRFEDLKENKANRETEMLRDVFLKSLGDEGAP